jgi:hypothetical protein
MLFHKNREMAKHFFFVAIVTLILFARNLEGNTHYDTSLKVSMESLH